MDFCLYDVNVPQLYDAVNGNIINNANNIIKMRKYRIAGDQPIVIGNINIINIIMKIIFVVVCSWLGDNKIIRFSYIQIMSTALKEC